MAKFDWSKYEEKPSGNQFDFSKYEEQIPEQQFEQPKQEGISSWLPRDIMIGLAKQGHNIINTPYELGKGIESGVNQIGANINQKLPLPNVQQSKPSLQEIVESFNKKNNVPKEMINPNWNKSMAERIPHQEEQDFAKILGQEGEPSGGSYLLQKGIEHAPEIMGLASLMRNLPVTSRGIMRQMSGHKTQALNQARTEYGNLFDEARQAGITHVLPPESAIGNRARITANSQNKYHQALNEYVQNPTVENAHWAQSELGHLERHLDSVANKNGLTPSQHRTLRAAQQTRNDIRNEMFSNNALGANPELGQAYQNLSNRYREEVVPYTRLSELTEAEQNRMLPKTAVKQLLNDDQFMIELARRYPGLRLHTQGAKKVIRTVGGLGATIGGWEGLKKLLK